MRRVSSIGAVGTVADEAAPLEDGENVASYLRLGVHVLSTCDEQKKTDKSDMRPSPNRSGYKMTLRHGLYLLIKIQFHVWTNGALRASSKLVFEDCTLSNRYSRDCFIPSRDGTGTVPYKH